jgi:hypothetical protein
MPSHSNLHLQCDCGRPKKRCLGPQNDPESLGPENPRKKTTKMKIETAKMTSVCDPVGIGGWPPIST